MWARSLLSFRRSRRRRERFPCIDDGAAREGRGHGVLGDVVRSVPAHDAGARLMASAVRGARPAASIGITTDGAVTMAVFAQRRSPSTTQLHRTSTNATSLAFGDVSATSRRCSSSTSAASCATFRLGTTPARRAKSSGSCSSSWRSLRRRRPRQRKPVRARGWPIRARSPASSTSCCGRLRREGLSHSRPSSALDVVARGGCRRVRRPCGVPRCARGDARKEHERAAHLRPRVRVVLWEPAVTAS